jgi:hypothetical protein
MSIGDARKSLIAQHREAEALYQTQFEVCAKTMGDQLKYMGTSTVVRDMDYITAQLEGPDALMSVRQPVKTYVKKLTVRVPATSGDSPTEQFWASTSSICEHAIVSVHPVSYYSIHRLPDRIGKVVIDGVADAVAWSCEFSLTLVYTS